MSHWLYQNHVLKMQSRTVPQQAQQLLPEVSYTVTLMAYIGKFVRNNFDVHLLSLAK